VLPDHQSAATYRLPLNELLTESDKKIVFEKGIQNYIDEKLKKAKQN